MNIDDYRETISDIKATEALKKRIINTVKSGEESKRLKFRRQVIIAVATCMAVAIMIPVLVLTVILPSVTPSGNSSRNPAAVTESSETTSMNDVSNVNSDTDPDLPKLTIIEDNGRIGGGIGFGYRKEDINERNPWTEEYVMDTFPVYKNFSIKLNENEMTAKGNEIAKKMGVTVNNLVVHPTEEERKAFIDKLNGAAKDYSDSETQTSYDIIMQVTYVDLICDDLRITVDTTGSVSINIKPTVELPDNIKESLKNTSNGNYDIVAEYLNNQYNLSEIKSPATRVITANNRVVSLFVYNKDADCADRILEFYFPYIYYAFDSESRLSGIYLQDYKLYEKIGDYPMITAEEAKKLLLENKYISGYTDMPKEESIYKVQLQLRNLDDLLIPYYVFYIETPSLKTEDWEVYGTYYVPAVKSKYFTNFPGEDGPLDFSW